MKNQLKKKSSAMLALAVSAAMLTQGANAAALGNLIAYSYLNEPLSLVINIDRLASGDEETLSVRILSAEAYAAAGVKRPSWADSAQARVKPLGNGRYGVEILTREPLTDPASSLLLELKAKSGDSTREYALLLDMKGDGARDPLKAQAVSVSPISAREFEKKAAEAPSPLPALPSSPKAAAVAASASARSAAEPSERPERETVRVRQGSALAIIARATARPGVSHEQMMLGYLRQNPGAFQDGNINRLKSGVIMRVPSKEQAQEVDTGKARRQVAEMAKDYKQWRAGSAAAAVPAASSAQAGSAAGGAVEKERAAPAAGPDELRLGKAGQGGAGGPSREDLLAKQKELEESQSRERDLQRVAEDLKKLLAIKDAQLAQLGAAQSSGPTPAPAATPTPEATTVAASAPASSGETAAMEAPAPESGETIAADGAVAPEAVAEPAAPVPTPAPTPAPASTVAVLIPAEPQAEAGFIEQNGSSALAAGGLLAALLAALGVTRYRRARKARNAGAATISSDPTTEPDRRGPEPVVEARDPVQERLEAADTFLSYGQDEKAFAELAAALAITPKHPEALIRMARLAAKAKDREAFQRASDDLRSGPAYNVYQRELFQLRSQLPKEEPAQDISKGLESFVESQERSDPAFEQGLAAGFAAASLDKAPREESRESRLAEDIGAMEALEPIDASESRFSSASMAPQAAADAGREDKSEPLEFESLSFDLGAPEDSPSNRFESLMDIPALGDEPSFGKAEGADPMASSSGASSSEIKTKLDLADAYLEMGDKEGAKELLLEVQREDSGELGERARRSLELL